MKVLYKQDVHHFDYLYPTLKAHKSQIIRILHSDIKRQVLSLQLKEHSHCFQQFHKNSQVYYKLALSLYTQKKYF